MSLYVPRGYVRISDAVERVFEARHPDLAADAVARAVEMQRLAFRHKELSINTSYRPKGGVPKATERWEAQVFEQIRVLERIGELQQIESEVRSLKNLGAIELHVGLAEGDMGGWLCHEDTSPRAISKFRWRRDDGLTIVWKAILADPVEDTDRPPVHCAVAIKEVDLVAWLDLNLQTGCEVTNHPGGRATEVVAQTMAAEKETAASAPIGGALAATEWMTTYATNYLAERGVPCKRDGTLAACRSGTRPHSTYRQALAAWNALPSNLKRTRQQTDRVIIGQMTGQ